MALWQRVNQADAGTARRLLGECCGSRHWIEAMMQRRPFSGPEAIQDAARETWWALGPEDWREAFSHHPKIGDRQALAARFPHTHTLSESEQSGVASAAETVLDQLAQGNRDYEERFGYIFIVCATGKSAEEMLTLLESRLPNAPSEEVRIAAGEQAKITAIRLSRD